MKKCCFCPLWIQILYLEKNAPCQLLHFNFKNKSDFCLTTISCLNCLHNFTRLCSSQNTVSSGNIENRNNRVVLRELDRERK